MDRSQTLFVCQENIKRYERLLRTPLSDLERQFIERRIAEEWRALKIARAEESGAAKAIKGITFKAFWFAFLPNLFDSLTSSFEFIGQVGLT
jgi:hypothetical protein